MRNPEQRRMERREARLDAAKRGLESLFASLRSNKRALSLLVPAIAVGISNPVEASTDMEPEKDRIELNGESLLEHGGTLALHTIDVDSGTTIKAVQMEFSPSADALAELALHSPDEEWDATDQFDYQLMQVQDSERLGGVPVMEFDFGTEQTPDDIVDELVSTLDTYKKPTTPEQGWLGSEKGSKLDTFKQTVDNISDTIDNGNLEGTAMLGATLESELQDGRILLIDTKIGYQGVDSGDWLAGDLEGIAKTISTSNGKGAAAFIKITVKPK